jgi:hypothetical protein
MFDSHFHPYNCIQHNWEGSLKDDCRVLAKKNKVLEISIRINPFRSYVEPRPTV